VVGGEAAAACPGLGAPLPAARRPIEGCASTQRIAPESLCQARLADLPRSRLAEAGAGSLKSRRGRPRDPESGRPCVDRAEFVRALSYGDEEAALVDAGCTLESTPHLEESEAPAWPPCASTKHVLGVFSAYSSRPLVLPRGRPCRRARESLARRSRPASVEPATKSSSSLPVLGAVGNATTLGHERCSEGSELPAGTSVTRVQSPCSSAGRQGFVSPRAERRPRAHGVARRAEPPPKVSLGTTYSSYLFRRNHDAHRLTRPRSALASIWFLLDAGDGNLTATSTVSRLQLYH